MKKRLSAAESRERFPLPTPMLPGADHLPTLDTPRLRLRWLTPADDADLLAVFGDIEVCRYTAREVLTELAGAAALREEIAASFAARTLFQWGLARRTDDRVLGTLTLFGFSAAHRRAEVGYALGRAHWGRGYVSEALDAALRFAFETLALHRLEADVDPRNPASMRVLERAGFTREGFLRERYHVHGEVQDAVYYGLLRREWEARQALARATA